MPMAITISPMNRLTVSRKKPPLFVDVLSTLVTSRMAIHITATATEIATSAVIGNSGECWAVASVMTPVIVPGLAANRITGSGLIQNV